MTLDMTSFGRLISSARKELKMSQKELAEKIVKEDGESITPQYLNDIEHDRRTPSSDYIVNQFATVLNVPPNVLFGAVGVLPQDTRKLVQQSTPKKVEQAYVAFRKKLQE